MSQAHEAETGGSSRVMGFSDDYTPLLISQVLRDHLVKTASPHAPRTLADLLRPTPSRFNTAAFSIAVATLDDAVERWLERFSDSEEGVQALLDGACRPNVEQLLDVFALGSSYLSPALLATLGHAVVQLARVTTPSALADVSSQLILGMVTALEGVSVEHGKPLFVAARNVLRTVGYLGFQNYSTDSRPLLEWVGDQLKVVLALEPQAGDLREPGPTGSTIVATSHLLHPPLQEQIRFAVTVLDYVGIAKNGPLDDARRPTLGAELAPLIRSLLDADMRVRAKATRTASFTLLDPVLLPTLESFLKRFPAGPSTVLTAPPRVVQSNTEETAKRIAEALTGASLMQNDVKHFIAIKEAEYGSERKAIVDLLEQEERKQVALETILANQAKEIESINQEALHRGVDNAVQDLLDRERRLQEQVRLLSPSRARK